MYSRVCDLLAFESLAALPICHTCSAIQTIFFSFLKQKCFSWAFFFQWNESTKKNTQFLVIGWAFFTSTFMHVLFPFFHAFGKEKFRIVVDFSLWQQQQPQQQPRKRNENPPKIAHSTLVMSYEMTPVQWSTDWYYRAVLCHVNLVSTFLFSARPDMR